MYVHPMRSKSEAGIKCDKLTQDIDIPNVMVTDDTIIIPLNKRIKNYNYHVYKSVLLVYHYVKLGNYENKRTFGYLMVFSNNEQYYTILSEASVRRFTVELSPYNPEPKHTPDSFIITHRVSPIF